MGRQLANPRLLSGGTNVLHKESVTTISVLIAKWKTYIIVIRKNCTLHNCVCVRNPNAEFRYSHRKVKELKVHHTREPKSFIPKRSTAEILQGVLACLSQSFYENFHPCKMCVCLHFLVYPWYDYPVNMFPKFLYITGIINQPWVADGKLWLKVLIQIGLASFR